ncbi:MAG: hypothetical protein EXR99_08610 [Gemmataceae bacterium]|nr:hypothetical protein [Gemmataceae bacterium]
MKPVFFGLCACALFGLVAGTGCDSGEKLQKDNTPNPDLMKDQKEFKPEGGKKRGPMKAPGGGEAK